MAKKKKTGRKIQEIKEEKHTSNDGKQSKQLKWCLIIIALAFIAFLGTYFYFKKPVSFDYAGVTWQRVDSSGLKLYYSVFPILGNSFNLYLINDPRENNIPVNAVFKFYPNAIISITPDAGNCRGAMGGQLNLGQFLGAGLKIKFDGALADKETADAMNLLYADCSDAVGKTVILIQKSETPSIEQEGNCYIINVGECENTKAIERFITAIVAQTNKKQL